MKAISDTLDVARSNLYSAEGKKRGPYRKAEDDVLLPLIREITDAKASFGYPFVTAMLNRRLKTEGKQTVNRKRVYRIMKQNELLLTRSAPGPVRRHEGKIITLKSDLRYCSDAFEIGCWNAERVRVVFSMDCCDREVIGYLATTKGIDAEMVQDLMVETVEARFGNVERAPHRVEWLTDNGSAFTAHDTRAFAVAIGLVPCTTPVRSPESNGMAESFVRTFKRDYVHQNRLDDAASVMAMLPAWFDDYNENRPHSGLKMLSPREYRQAQSLTGSMGVSGK